MVSQLGHDFVFKTIGKVSVYPGHGITVGLLIMEAFDSLESASERHPEFGSSAAAGSSLIPGSGGCVGDALWILKLVKEGSLSIEAAVKAADDAWVRVDDQKARYPDRWREGQDQADTLKARYCAKLATWPEKHVPEL